MCIGSNTNMKKIFRLIPLILVLVLLLRFVSYKNPTHPLPVREITCLSDADQTKPLDERASPRCEALAAINQDYIARVKPIFEQKCLMCHGTPHTLPLYARVYPSKWLVDHDIEEARDEADMRYDFPWRANTSVKKHRHDLSEVAETIEEAEMPPLIYKVMHWDSGVTANEKEIILDWVKKSKETLR